MRTNTVIAIGLVLAFTFGVILLWAHHDPQSLFGYPPNVQADAQKNLKQQISDESYPVYKLIGRMDFAISNPNPASTAYVFERGGIYEYVLASHVNPLTPCAELKLTGYFVKVKDGTFYPLETEAK